MPGPISLLRVCPGGGAGIPEGYNRRQGVGMSRGYTRGGDIPEGVGIPEGYTRRQGVVMSRGYTTGVIYQKE